MPATPRTRVAPLPVTDPQAQALLDQVIARYGALDTLAVTINGTQLVQFKAPAMAKVTTRNDKGKLSLLQVYTGKNTIVMQKPNDAYEYILVPLKPVPAGQTPRTQVSKTGIGGPILSSLLAGLNPFRADGFKATSYTLGQPVTKDGILVTPIKVTTAKSPRLAVDLAFTLFVDTKDDLIYRTEIEVKYPNGQKQTVVDTFEYTQIGTDIPSETFTFNPPAGAVKVKDFSDPVVRAKVGQMPIVLPVGTKDINGRPLSFDQFKGKVTLVDFWATWCGPCVAELPNVKAVYNKYHNRGFQILGVSLDKDTAPLRQFIKERNMTWRQVWDGYWSGPIAEAYNVKGIPQTLLLGKDGKIIGVSSFTKEGKVLGPMGENLEPAVQAALTAK